MSSLSTGAQAIYHRHHLATTLHDELINLHVNRAIYWRSKEYKGSHIHTITFNNIVVLTGQVYSKKQHTDLNHLVMQVPGVKRVYNLTTIASPSSTLTRFSDTWITTKIASQLIAQNEIEPSQIKVFTENGTVYLMGITFPEQANIAVEIAKKTSGVQQIVRIFSYLHISAHPTA